MSQQQEQPAIRFVSLPTKLVEAYQAGFPDANGQEPERHLSDGDGIPCRHCQTDVAAGDEFLILGYRPFPAPQPYAEVGPIFIHAGSCLRYPESDRVPEMFLERESYLLKGYCSNDRIVYGTGRIVPSADIAAAAQEILADPQVAYVHVRSALNNCYQCRIERA